MKTKFLPLLILFLAISVTVDAQNEFFHGRMNRERMKKIDQLERLKLMDILDVDDEVLIKFLKELKEFKLKTWELFELKDSLARQVRQELNGSEVSDEKIAETIDKIFDIDKQTFSLKSEFLNTAKETLPPKELAKFILFEQNFRRELMRAYEKKRFKEKQMMKDMQ